jgi:hypothetical protein
VVQQFFIGFILLKSGLLAKIYFYGKKISEKSQKYLKIGPRKTAFCYHFQ